MENVIIETPEYIRVCMLGEFGEFLGTVDLYPHKVKDCVWQAHIDEPKDVPKGFSAVYNPESKEWDYVEDYRGTTVRNLKTDVQELVEYLGPLKDYHTFEL